MKTLKDLHAPLKHKATIIVPSTQGLEGVAATVSVSRAVELVQRAFTQHYGGSTTVDGWGTYEADNGAVVEERVVVISAGMDELDEYIQNHLIHVCEVIKNMLGQERISLEVDNKLYFV